MIYQIKIDDQVFHVEIHDLLVRPIIAIVNGEPIEVWPEDDQKLRAPHPVVTRQAETKPLPQEGKAYSKRAVDSTKSNSVHAPIPGVIVSIAVKPGDSVGFGQELCILEAMKMKNAIRATRDGTINSIHVSAGQQVKHHDILMDYLES